MFKKLHELFFTKDFCKGIVFELILFVVSIGAVIWSVSRIPLHANGYNDEVGTAAFLTMGIVGVVTALFTRSVALHMIAGTGQNNEIDNRQSEIITKIVTLTLALPVVAYFVLFPWVLSGAFNDDHMNTIASAFLLFLVAVVLLPLLGILGAAFVIYPIEMTARGVVRIIRTRGKEWTQLAIGLFGMVVLAFITAGSMAVDTHLTGQAGSMEALLAILGIPGGYEVKNEAMLWTARGLFVAFVAIALAGKFVFGLDPSKPQNAVRTKQKRQRRAKSTR